MKCVVVISCLLLLAGCSTTTTPLSYTDIKLSTGSYGQGTQYGIENHENGFALAVYYSRYQFLSDGAVVVIECKNRLAAIAREYADDIGKKIEPINESRLRVSTGRDEFFGITSCQADTVVQWKSG